MIYATRYVEEEVLAKTNLFQVDPLHPLQVNVGREVKYKNPDPEKHGRVCVGTTWTIQHLQKDCYGNVCYRIKLDEDCFGRPVNPEDVILL